MTSSDRAVRTDPGGPLRGLGVVELAGLGPGPFAAMLLADLGADVVRVERADDATRADRVVPDLVLRRSRRSIAVDIKHDRGVEVVLALAERADVLIEGFRPGVAERLGIGPDVCLARNPRLVYGRVTGWGQDGPLAASAGHDINYIALTGALAAIGPPDGPLPPLSLVGDFGGGGMLLAVGVLAAIVERARSGRGQVVDAAMADGASLLMSAFHGMHAAGLWSLARGTNVLDGGAPYYRAYRTSDGGHVAVGAIERRFWDDLCTRLGVDGRDRSPSRWAALADELTQVFASATAAAWSEQLEGTDACCTVVRSLGDAPEHPHNVARNSFVTLDGVPQPAPAPRFSRTPAPSPIAYAGAGSDSRAVLAELGWPDETVAELVASGVVVDRAASA